MPKTISIGSYVRLIGCDWRGKVIALYPWLTRADGPLTAIVRLEDGYGIFAESVDRLELAPPDRPSTPPTPTKATSEPSKAVGWLGRSTYP